MPWAVELSEIQILLKIKLEWINYILIDYKSYFLKFFTVVSQNEVVQWFVKPIIIILFWTHPVTVRFEDDFRFGTTTELSL